jgi:hypothetical protein
MAIVDTLIQTGLTEQLQECFARDSQGRIYVIYKKTSGNHLFVAYSTNAGASWIEVDSGSTIITPSPTNTTQISCCIDSQDRLHVVYAKSSDNQIHYKQFTIAGGWTTEENSVIANSSGSCNVAVDSADDVHVVATDNNTAGVRYNKRTAGTWGTNTLIIASGSGDGWPKIAVDSLNNLFVVCNVGGTMKWLKYNGSFWTSAVALSSAGTLASDSAPRMCIDSNDNVYVVWHYIITATDRLWIVKYTKSTDTWGAGAQISGDAGADSLAPSISVDANNNLNVIFNHFATSNKIYYTQSTNGGSSWSAAAVIATTGGHSLSYPVTRSNVWPVVDGEHVTIPDVGYETTYYDFTDHALRYYAPDGVTYPAPEGQNYSRKANASLPSGDSNLTNIFTAAEYAEVLAEDSVFADQAATDQYAIFQFKNRGNNSSDDINVSWTGKSSIAPSTSTVVLQIYNRTSGLWETLDSNNSASANTPFTLSGSKVSSLSSYYDGNNWVSCRVYQLAQ